MRAWGLALAVGLAACVGGDDGIGADEGASTANDPTLAQMNDVSVLLPLPADEAGLMAMTSAAAPARGGELLPRAVYEAAFGEPGTLQAGGTPAAPNHETLRLVSYRLDPCFGSIGTGAIGPAADDPGCVSQLRAVFQRVVMKAGVPQAKDEAVHAFYALSREELAAAVEAQVALRMERGAGALGPLAVHPLAAEDPEVARALAELVTTYAGADNLTRMTLFTTSGLGTAWNFSGFDVAADGPTRMKLPAVPEGTEVVAFFRGFQPGGFTGEPAFTPASIAPAEDDMQLLGNADEAARASEQERQQAFDALLRIESPDFHSPDTTDCVSCHVADPIRRLVAEPLFGLRPSSEEVVPPFAGPEVAETSVDPELDLHMFSYVGRQASIHRRTVQETAAVVAYMNEQRR